MMFLFWKMRWFNPVFMLWEFYSNETARDSRLCETLQVIFSEAVAVAGIAGGKQKNGSDYSHHEVGVGDDGVDNDLPQLLWGLLEIAGCLSATQLLFSHHFLFFWLPLHIHDARLPVHLYHSVCSVWHTYCFSILSSTANQRNNKTSKNSTATFSVSRSEEASTPGWQSSTRKLPHKHICPDTHTHTHAAGAPSSLRVCATLKSVAGATRFEVSRTHMSARGEKNYRLWMQWL